MNAINYGGHNVPEPQPADMPTTNQGEQKIPQGGGKTATAEGGARAWAMDPAMPYGYVGNSVSGLQQDRMDQFPDWDGDLRWPAPDFLASERNRAARLRAMDRQQQEIAWQQGRTQLAQLRRDEIEARMWDQRGND